MKHAPLCENGATLHDHWSAAKRQRQKSASALAGRHAHDQPIEGVAHLDLA
jgi:hypothetical protein